MKIVIINGSARKGNTLTAINAFIKGASEKNEIEIIEPDKLNIAPRIRSTSQDNMFHLTITKTS